MDKYIYFVKEDNLNALFDFAKNHDIDTSDMIIYITNDIEFIDDDTFRLPIKTSHDFENVSYFDGCSDLYYRNIFSNTEYTYYSDEAVSFLYKEAL